MHHFHIKQIEWGLHNGPKNGVLPVTNFKKKILSIFFLNFVSV